MKDCVGCTRKHLAQAMIIHEEEVFMGYPEHIERVIGHLAEAAREVFSYSKPFAAILRNHRLAVMDNDTHMPPYMELLEFVTIMAAAKNASLPCPGVPDTLDVNTTKT